MRGDGYWLNPETRAYVKVVRHELSMRSAADLARLGLPPSVSDEAARYSPFDRAGEDALRRLGVDYGLVRIRDHGYLVSVQFSAAPEAVQRVVRSSVELLQMENLFRPYVKLSNFVNGA